MYGLIESLSELIRIPSISGDQEACDEALNYVLELGREFGLKTGKAAGGRVGFIEMGKGNETLGVLTHVDVAHPGNIAKWEHNPFMPVLGGGKIYGRGVIDDKGPVISALFAMKDVLEASRKHRVPMNKKIRLIVGTQQKIGAGDMREYLLENPAPTYSFTPDGNFEICNLQLGTLDLLLSFPLYDENPQIVDIKAGSNIETIPDICKIKLKDGRVFATKGMAGHASEPALYANAILEMARTLSKLKRRAKAEMQEDLIYRVLQKLEQGFSDGTGFHLGIASMPNSQREKWGRNRVAPTGIFCHKDRLYININCHYTADTTDAYLVRSISKFFKNEVVRIERVSTRHPSEASKGLPFIKELQEAYNNVLRKECGFGVNAPSTYAQIVPNTIVFGPSIIGKEDMRHRPGEYMHLKDLMLMQMIFGRAMANIVFKEKSFQLGG